MKPFLNAAALIVLAFLASVATTSIDRARMEAPWSGNMFFECPATQTVTQSEFSPWRTYRHEWPVLTREFPESAAQNGGWE